MDSADLSDSKLKNGDAIDISSRPSMDTEAVSGDEGGGETTEYRYDDTMFEEIKVDPSMLDPSCLVPPTIPGSLGAEDIDKVIAALTNVPDVRILPPGSPIKRSGGAPARRPLRLSPPLDDVSVERGSKRRRSDSRDRSYRRDRDDDSGDDRHSSRHRRRRRSGRYSDDDLGPLPLPGSLLRPMFRGRVFRGRVRLRARGARGVGRGIFIGGDRGGGFMRGGGPRGGFFDGGRGGGGGIRPPLPVARGRNIFPADEERGGRGRGRFPRENNLFKRFKQQHRGLGEKGDGEEDEFGEVRRWDEVPYSSPSRSRSRSGDRSSSSSFSSSSGSDSDSKKKKKKEKKKHKKRKKKSEEKKKKKKRSKDSESEEEEEGEGSGWRLELLNRMKEIKKLPPEQLEVEFKKAMAEKRRKEEEEKCLEQIKLRQKLARKVKKEAERAAKKAAKEARRKARKEESEGGGENAFYAGFTAAMARGDEGLAGPPGGGGSGSPPRPVHVFKPAFSELPYSVIQDEEAQQGPPEVEGEERQQQEMDPYTRALEESMRKMPKEETEDVSWPAGALEEQEYEMQLTREQVEQEQEIMEKQTQDRTREVVTASKMFSKIRNRIRSKPLKINLKTSRPTLDEEPGLQPHTGENTPGEIISGDEGEEVQAGYEEGWYDEDQTQYDMGIRDEESELVRRMERIRRRKERREMLAAAAGGGEREEREDGEHSPSPQPERPHHRRRRKRRHEQKEGTPLLDEMGNGGLEEGEIGNETPTSSVPTSAGWPPPYGPPPSRVALPPPSRAMVAPPPIPFVDTSVPPPSLGGAYAPPLFPVNKPPPSANIYPLAGPPAGRYDAYSPAAAASYSPLVPPAPPPPVPILNPELAVGGGGSYGGKSTIPPALRPVGPMGDHASDKYFADRPGQREESGYPRERDRYDRRFNDYDRRPSEERFDRRSSRREDRYDEYGRERSRRSAERVDEYHSRSSRSKSYREESPEEPANRSQEELSVDITKITPLMKYIAKHLEESKYPLELRGPFTYRDDIPGLSKHLFVAFKMVNILQAAGLDQSKMYMKAMFPAGMADTKKELMAKVANGGLDPRIQGPKLVKMCVRCIKCFLAYFTGNKEDLESSEEEEEEDGEEEGGGKGGR